MARLQILQLPEGVGDDRPPFLLVVDEVTDKETERLVDSQEAIDGMAKKAGARAVAVFHGMTVDIPANDPLPVVEDPERAGTAQIVYAHERTRLDLCAALLVSGDTPWRKLIEHVTERQRELAGLYRKLDERGAPTLAQAALKHSGTPYSYDGASREEQPSEVIEQLKADVHEARQWARHGYEIGQRHCGWSDHGVAPEWLTEGWPPHFDSCEHLKRAAEYDEALTRVRNLPERPETMAVNPEHPYAYLDGYAAGIRDAKRAAGNERATAAEDGA